MYQNIFVYIEAKLKIICQYKGVIKDLKWNIKSLRHPGAVLHSL